jgi:tetratricopeptide (TPR) repeat protein
MLMALGVAAITTFLVLRTLKLFRARDLSFYRHELKSAGTIRKAGWAFIAFALVWIGLNVHTGLVRYHEHSGYQAFQQLRIPDELALAQLNPETWINPTQKQNIVAGKAHFQTASSIGLFTNADALSKQGWFEYLSGEADRSVVSLQKAAASQHDQPKALSLYYRGAILNRLGRYDEAFASLEQALAVRDDLISASVEKGESLWQLGRKDEAISVWSSALNRNPRLVLAANQLAGAAFQQGRVVDASAYAKQADQVTPTDPYYHWMLGLRLQHLNMNELAEKHFKIAMQIDPSFQARRRTSQ